MINFDVDERLIFLQQLIDGEHGIAAGKWLDRIERENIKVCDKENDFNEIRNDIHQARVEEEAKEKFEKLCKSQTLKLNQMYFEKSFTFCKYMFEDKNVLMKYKVEELSPEPKVFIVHDFLSEYEITELLSMLDEDTLGIAPVIGDDADDDINAYFNIRAAKSHYVNESYDDIGEFAQKTKKR